MSVSLFITLFLTLVSIVAGQNLAYVLGLPSFVSKAPSSAVKFKQALCTTRDDQAVDEHISGVAPKNAFVSADEVSNNIDAHEIDASTILDMQTKEIYDGVDEMPAVRDKHDENSGKRREHLTTESIINGVKHTKPTMPKKAYWYPFSEIDVSLCPAKSQTQTSSKDDFHNESSTAISTEEVAAAQEKPIDHYTENPSDEKIVRNDTTIIDQNLDDLLDKMLARVTTPRSVRTTSFFMKVISTFYKGMARLMEDWTVYDNVKIQDDHFNDTLKLPSVIHI